jgi:hypothetical protein
MRTKTLLLAVTALAAGILTSQSAVTSANIVGYANVPTLNPFNFYLLACPFNVGASNGANEIFGTTLPDTSQILTWDANSQSYITAVYDGSQGNGTNWYKADDATPGPIPRLLTGQAFFLFPADVYTNTFVGSVSVAVGTTNTMSFSNPFNFYMVSSVIPYAGVATNSSIALTGLPDTSQVLTWDANSQSYITAVYDASQGNGTNWYKADDATPGPAPSLSVGQGFFLFPADVYSWKQTL